MHIPNSFVYIIYFFVTFDCSRPTCLQRNKTTKHLISVPLNCQPLAYNLQPLVPVLVLAMMALSLGLLFDFWVVIKYMNSAFDIGCFLVHFSSSWASMKLHTKNQLPRLSERFYSNAKRTLS